MNFGDNLKENDSNTLDLKKYIEENKESLEIENQFIDELKEEVGDYKFNLVTTDNIVEENNTEEDEQHISMNVLIDPQTGEHKIIGRADEDIKYDFEGVIKQINDSDPDILTTKPFTEQEIISYLKSTDDDVLVSELAGGNKISAQSIRDFLDIVNRKINGEKFNVYKESPEEIKKLVDSYISEGLVSMNICNNKMLLSARNRIANSLLDEFIHNIRMDRAKTDFAKELENIYNCCTSIVTEDGIEYIDERNKAYREATNSIEDEDKKYRLNAILDRIDEARNLTELKEFAKKCKIKKYDIERPDKRAYTIILSKYRDSVNNIYDISIAETVLCRQMEAFGCNRNDVVMLLIAFCKQCEKYSVDNVLDHAYMYYFLYYCVMLDGDKSDKFRNNLLEVINNIKQRNKF